MPFPRVLVQKERNGMTGVRIRLLRDLKGSTLITMPTLMWEDSKKKKITTTTTTTTFFMYSTHMSDTINCFYNL